MTSGRRVSGKLEQLGHSSLSALRSEQAARAGYRLKRAKLRRDVLSFDRHGGRPNHTMPRMLCKHANSTLSPACMGTTIHAST